MSADQLTIDDVTFFRHQGNQFSTEANKSIRKDKSRLREEVYRFVASQQLRGATSEEVVNATGMSLQTVSGRMSELKAQDRIALVGKRPTSSGRSAGVWKVAQ